MAIDERDIDKMDIDAIDVIDEMDIDKDINFRNDKAPLGEDVHFICIEGETIGVADGVGGGEGINSREYSRQLCDKVHAVNIGDSGFVVIIDRGCDSDGSNGLFDNVHDYELKKLVCGGLVDLHKLGIFSKMLAQKTVEYALQNSESKTICTSFVGECSKVGKRRVGGKRNDITVIVAHILPL
ncbi:hypothetical protein HAX54_010707 [Datura stramonium]|uniref:Protein phosphatase n=1 Tax=Datura stramonium TaxID=4076 RepID=A0ABS8TIK6_DATST|nr:hypothetical protein [Datura stramonium]